MKIHASHWKIQQITILKTTPLLSPITAPNRAHLTPDSKVAICYTHMRRSLMMKGSLNTTSSWKTTQIQKATASGFSSWSATDTTKPSKSTSSILSRSGWCFLMGLDRSVFQWSKAKNVGKGGVLWETKFNTIRVILQGRSTRKMEVRLSTAITTL